MRRAIVLSVHLLLLLSPNLVAAGLLVPRSGEAPIRIRSHRVSATLEDGIARTTVRQTFVNPHSRPLEAIYLFPLPEGAALCDVAMEVGGKRLEGLLAERKQARRVYNEIVRSRRDPALVEQIGRSKFRLSVFPVLPNVATVVELTYIEQVPLARGTFRYVYPLALGGKASKTEGDLTFTLTVKSSVPLEAVVTNTPNMDLVGLGSGDCVATLERTGAALDRDITVEARILSGRPALDVKTFRDEQGEGWFLLLVTPPAATEEDLVPRDVILVIDTSGSMEGEKIRQARTSALYLLDNLRPADRVNVLLFSSSVRPFADRPVPATRENLAALREFVNGIQAQGGTAIADALKQALDAGRSEGRVRTVVFLTDGQPTLGETRPEAIVRIARAGRASGLRIFPFGVGDDVDAGLLEGMAEATRGRAEVFRPGGEIETRLKRFLRRTSAPVLADLEVNVPGSHDVFPRPLPDAYLGEQVAIVGRYSRGGPRDIALSATAGSRRIELTAHADFRSEPGGSPAVRDLFARRKLGYLERQLRLRTGLSDDAYFAALDRGAYSTQDEIVGEIISVSLDHGVQSAYTSFIVLLPEDRHRINPRDRVALEKALERVREVRGKLSGASERVADGRSKAGPKARAGFEAPGEEPEVEELIEEEEEVGESEDATYESSRSTAAIGLGGGAGGAFGGRRGGRRGLRRRYGGMGTAEAVDLGLKWLARQQIPDEGYWPGNPNPTANTGLAMLAILGGGHTHQAGPFKKHVGESVKYLKRIQDAQGCFGDPNELHAHAIATLAMTEAYAMSSSPLLRRSSEKGIAFLVRANPSPNDGYATVWTAMAFASARNAGLSVPDEAIDRIRSRLLSLATPGRPTPATNAPAFIPGTEDARLAAVLFARILLGEDPRTSEPLERSTVQLLEALKRHEQAPADQRDVGFWYFGTLAMFQVGGVPWRDMNRAMKKVLLASQAKEGDNKGSWDAAGSTATTLGRVGTAALLTMCNEVYYRYSKVFGTR